MIQEFRSEKYGIRERGGSLGHLGNRRGQKNEIKNFMRAKVGLWIEKQGSRKFTVRKRLALAKIDPDWTGTPLRALTDHYLGFRPEVAARKAAGRALGWLVKSMLKEDARVFHTSQVAVRSYWLKV